MKKHIVFRHMEHSDILEKYINEQLVKVEEYLAHEREPVFLDVIVEANPKKNHHRFEIIVKTPHYDFVHHVQGPELYDLVNHVVDRVYQELHEKKEERLDRRKTGDSYKGA